MRELVILAVASCLISCGSGDSDPPRPDGTVIQLSLEELVEAYEAGTMSRDDFRAAIAAFDDSGRPSAITADIDGTELLKARTEPYTIDADISVVDGAILVIEAGAEVRLGQGVNLRVLGRIYAVGSEASPILINAAVGERYGVVELANGPNQFVWTEFDRGTRNVFVTNASGTRSLLHKCRFDSFVDAGVRQDFAAGTHILESRFGYMTPAPDVAGESIVAWQTGTIIIEKSAFSYRVGYKDVIDLQECAEGSWPMILGNTFDGGEDDGIDLDTCSALVIGNKVSNFRPVNLNLMTAGVNGGGITGDAVSRPVIINNLIDNCFHGIGFKNGATPIIVNNTITNSNIGVTLYQSVTGNPVPHGIMINNVLWNNVGWLNSQPQDVVLNGKWWPSYNQVDDVQGTLEASYNIFATDPTPPPGTSNLSSDPQLELVDGVPVPKAGSPALNSGLAELSFTDVPMERVIEYLKTDFRGQARAESGGSFPGIDRGAIEAAP